mmetsp:Transcript_45616/g.52536  ORF Transcript_45616/g.52536 Transcript_45616/m.52536 type:complete len:202 (+) Transcript_45616:1014-1619(+)
MHTEDLFVNNGSNGQAVEAIGESFPQFNTVSTFAFIIKAIDSVDRGTFMVPPQKEEVFGVLDFVSQQQTDGFQTLLATINIVTQKQIIGLRRESTIFKQSQQIIVLAMNVTTDLQRCLQLKQNRLIDEDLPRFQAKSSHLKTGKFSQNNNEKCIIDTNEEEEEEKTKFNPCHKKSELLWEAISPQVRKRCKNQIVSLLFPL